ncbi:hypothetical protein DFR70_10778 [Nocardia tenerifensis]|uniref:Uncharacterized protein n=1 Tax=Nocardia tenerifensis TaxID=228006 RepID=A0A318K320_9NOCA|nr:hypothetical protein DFR70_10778 [Nocardia tenerifensis]
MGCARYAMRAAWGALGMRCARHGMHSAWDPPAFLGSHGSAECAPFRGTCIVCWSAGRGGFYEPAQIPLTSLATFASRNPHRCRGPARRYGHSIAPWNVHRATGSAPRATNNAPRDGLCPARRTLLRATDSASRDGLCFARRTRPPATDSALRHGICTALPDRRRMRYGIGPARRDRPHATGSAPRALRNLYRATGSAFEPGRLDVRQLADEAVYSVAPAAGFARGCDLRCCRRPSRWA